MVELQTNQSVSRRTNICTCGHGEAHHDDRYLKCRCPISYHKMCLCEGLELDFYIQSGQRFNKYGEVVFR